jgi:hypothetical protein
MKYVCGAFSTFIWTIVVQAMMLVYSKDVCFLDTETAGLDYDSEIFELAITDRRGIVLLKYTGLL